MSTYNQGVQSKLSFDVIDFKRKYFRQNHEGSYLWFGRKIKLYTGLIDEKNDDIYWWSLGVFIITGVSRKDGVLSVECVDKFGILTPDTGFSVLDLNSKLPAQNSLHDIVKQILSTEMGNGNILDPITPLIDAELRNINNGIDLEMSAGSNLGDYLTELAFVARCRMYYGRNGNLRLQTGTLDTFYSGVASVWTFDDEFTAEYLNSSLNFDFTRMINQITVWGEDSRVDSDGGTGRLYSCTAINTDPRSPARVSLIGKKIGMKTETMYGYNQENVNAFAEFYLETKSIQAIRIPISTTLIPHLKVGNIAMLTNADYHYDSKNFLVNEIGISGSGMTVSLVNFDVLPFHKELL